MTHVNTSAPASSHNYPPPRSYEAEDRDADRRRQRITFAIQLLSIAVLLALGWAAVERKADEAIRRIEKVEVRQEGFGNEMLGIRADLAGTRVDVAVTKADVQWIRTTMEKQK
jgi:hypothetical protein